MQKLLETRIDDDKSVKLLEKSSKKIILTNKKHLVKKYIQNRNVSSKNITFLEKDISHKYIKTCKIKS